MGKEDGNGTIVIVMNWDKMEMGCSRKYLKCLVLFFFFVRQSRKSSGHFDLPSQYFKTSLRVSPTKTYSWLSVLFNLARWMQHYLVQINIHSGRLIFLCAPFRSCHGI
jgi:hypothetical protein